jgi:lactate permease
MEPDLRSVREYGHFTSWPHSRGLLVGSIATGRFKIPLRPSWRLPSPSIAIWGFTMPRTGAARGCLGALTGSSIGWIILNVIFLYRMTVERGWFAIMQHRSGHTPDRPLQLLLIAFAFGRSSRARRASVPCAVTGAILMARLRPLPPGLLTPTPRLSPWALGTQSSASARRG